MAAIRPPCRPHCKRHVCNQLGAASYQAGARGASSCTTPHIITSKIPFASAPTPLTVARVVRLRSTRGAPHGCLTISPSCRWMTRPAASAA